MPKYVYIQLHPSASGGHPDPIRIRADKFEKVAKSGEGHGRYVVKLGDQVVGEFVSVPAGWWIQDE